MCSYEDAMHTGSLAEQNTFLEEEIAFQILNLLNYCEVLTNKCLEANNQILKNIAKHLG